MSYAGWMVRWVVLGAGVLLLCVAAWLGLRGLSTPELSTASVDDLWLCGSAWGGPAGVPDVPDCQGLRSQWAWVSGLLAALGLVLVGAATVAVLRGRVSSPA